MNSSQLAWNFELCDSEYHPFSLSDHIGRNLVLAFFPNPFGPVCISEMRELADRMDMFEMADCEVIAISKNNPSCLAEMKRKLRLPFTVLSDFNGDVSKTYSGFYDNYGGVNGLSLTRRAVFMIEKGGNIVYRWIGLLPDEEPKYWEIEDVLEKWRSENETVH